MTAALQRYRILVEHSTEAILVMDADNWKFVDANENAVRLFGWPREALLGMRPTDLNASRQPDGRSYQMVAIDVARRERLIRRVGILEVWIIFGCACLARLAGP